MLVQLLSIVGHRLFDSAKGCNSEKTAWDGALAQLQASSGTPADIDQALQVCMASWQPE